MTPDLELSVKLSVQEIGKLNRKVNQLESENVRLAEQIDNMESPTDYFGDYKHVMEEPEYEENSIHRLPMDGYVDIDDELMGG